MDGRSKLQSLQRVWEVQHPIPLLTRLYRYVITLNFPGCYVSGMQTSSIGFAHSVSAFDPECWVISLSDVDDLKNIPGVEAVSFPVLVPVGNPVVVFK